MICSIQFKFESITIPRYFALYTVAIEVSSIIKSLQLVFFILALDPCVFYVYDRVSTKCSIFT